MKNVDECIILAGGFGTRLQSVVSDVPKSMALVANRPFLEYLFEYLEQQDIKHVVLSLGYKADVVIDWLKLQQRKFDISYQIEETPLGTGGAIKFAFEKIQGDSAFIINGDTFFDVNLNRFQTFHKSSDADISIVLREMSEFDRYGSVNIASDNRITRFNENKYCKSGLINGGTYLINKVTFERLNTRQQFSFEKDVLEAHISDIQIYGHIENGYFIDIGIPSDFEKANLDFKSKF